jgi:hypothetical protein
VALKERGAGIAGQFADPPLGHVLVTFALRLGLRIIEFGAQVAPSFFGRADDGVVFLPLEIFHVPGLVAGQNFQNFELIFKLILIF